MENSTRKPLIISHFPCCDGFASRAIFFMRYGNNVEYMNGTYGQGAIPDVKGRDVVIADFSYPLPMMEKIIKLATTVTILDHHVTAKDDLEHLLESKEVLGVFDMTKSGAMLCWEYCFPDKPVPIFVEYVQDRDLGKNDLPNTEEVAAAVFSYEYKVETYIKLLKLKNVDELISDGIPLLRGKQKNINEAYESMIRMLKIGDYLVPAVNLFYPYATEAASGLLPKFPKAKFAVAYFHLKDSIQFSLRSHPDSGFNVGNLARKWGGGGHENAAGFHVPFKDFHKFETKE